MVGEILSIILKNAERTAYASYDISDLFKTKYYRYVQRTTNPYVKRLLLIPYMKIKQYFPSLIRYFVKEKNYVYAQGIAMVIRAHVVLIKKGHKLGDLVVAQQLAQWLIANRSLHSKHFGWGQPFWWRTRKMVPPNTPRATVSSQVALALLDLYEITGEDKYLNIAEDVCRLFKYEFNYKEDENGSICISYTTLDNYHVHNASIYAASVVFRVAKLTNSQDWLDFGKSILSFTLSHQNNNGSFYYWAPPDKLNYTIDNYHTGFLLECFESILKVHYSKDLYLAYESGLAYFYNNLFNGPKPKITNDRSYPIDIQSCAQSIIVFHSGHAISSKYCDKAYQIANYTIENLFVKSNNHFGYRLYANGFFDKSYYFRWGDAWMIRALSLLV